ILDVCRGNDRWPLVDGAHAIGAMDVDITKLDVDAYAANGHKWMMAPCGVGFFHASPRLKNILEPLVRSWGEDYDIDRMDKMLPETGGPDFHSTKLQFRIEYTGVADRIAQMVLPEAIDFMKRVGFDRAYAESERLRDYLCKRMESIGMDRAGPKNPALRSSITVFKLNPIFANTLRKRLWDEYRILVPVTRCAGHSYLRISTAWFYTEAMIDRVVEAMDRELKMFNQKRDVA
ncbi:MAG TPA: aminotransferase class V-fold PLP-dependent enzyme, partial [Tepidisphaeraceae bacterium]|nr:aminotransferase class V-fold PLP-dependent enzyme [Tepidisphaeraceae bacterium]